MKRQESNAIIEKEKIVAIVRLKTTTLIDVAIKSLVEGGVKVLELTSNTPDYLRKIRESRKIYPDILIGAGTVTSLQIARQSIEAGAEFLVTPHTDPKIIEFAHANDIPVLMGAMTPSEINVAASHGADFIKLFPAEYLGINYFKSIRAPYNGIRFIAVGGIGPANLKNWLKAGVSGVGIGGNLLQLSNEGLDEHLTKKVVQQTIKLIKSYGT